MQANQDIRKTAAKNGVRIWQIADKLGVHEVTLVKRLRYELSEAEKAEIFDIIDALATVKERRA